MTSTTMDPENQQSFPPTKEQVTKFLLEQIEVKELQSRLQSLNTKIAVERANELEAFAKASHFSKPLDDVKQHVVTEQDLINNPDLSSQNIKVGDTIGIPVAAMEDFMASK